MNEKVKDIVNFIKSHKRFLITSHINLDGDSIGAQLSLRKALLKLGKRVEIWDESPVPEIYRFLPDWKFIRQTPPEELEFDGIFILDCGDIERVGNILKNVKSYKALINIDHHMSNQSFGDLNWVDIGMSSTSEMIFYIVEELNIEIDPEIATYIYVGILTDTGSFRFANTTSSCFLVASKLISYGVKPKEIAEAIFYKISFKRLKLLGLVLANSKLTEDGIIIYSDVTKKMLDETKTDISDTEDFVNFLKFVEGAKVAVLFKEAENNLVRVSLRSKGDINVSQIAKIFGGGGHFNAAGCTVSGEFNEVKRRVLEVIKNNVKKT